MKRKLLSILLTLCLAFSLLPTAALADEAEGCVGGENCSHQAAIGDTHYSTLVEAVSAAKNGETITLTDNIKVENTLVVTKTLTLDLAGHTLSNDTDIWSDYNWSLISVRGNGNLTITGNGTLKAKENDCYPVDVQDEGAQLTIENGTFIGNIHAVYVETGAAYIKGGTYSVQQKYTDPSKGDEFVLNLYDANRRNGTAKLSVSGGTFVAFDPANCQAEAQGTNFCAAGYTTTTEDNNTYTVVEGENAAVANAGANYNTLANAISSAASGDTVTLLKDTKEDITIPSGKTITLDLNGKTLTNKDDHTILNNGNLTITGTGKVDNISHAKGALYNKGTVIVNGGTFDRTKENGKNKGESGQNSWYTIKNVGTMTINDGATVQTAGNNAALGKFSSLVSNGYFDANDYNTNKGLDQPILTIDGGTFRGGLNTIKNDDRAKLTINGGTFSNYYQAVVQNHNIAEITGGTFTAASDANAETYGIYNCGCAADIDLGTLIVSGGTFTGATYAVADVSTQSATVNISNGQFAGTKAAIIKSSTSNATITISGGYFTSDPTAYLAAGKGLVTSDQNAFAYKVGDKDTDVETAVTAGEAAVTIPEGVSGITEDKVKAAAKVANTTKTLTDTVAASGMTNDPAVVGTKEAAEAALSANNISVGGSDTVTVVVQPYLEVNVKSADGKLTLEISAKYNVVATTGNPATIEWDKTVTLKSGVPLSINKPIELTIVLPTGFAAVNSKIYVQHKGYEYTATVDASGATATFINPHGFSTFTVTSTASAVAEVDGTNYTDLQKAVDAVANNGTVKLLNDTSASAVVSRAVKFTLDKNSKSFTGAITAGSGYELSVDGNVYTFTVRSSSGSSGGSSYDPTYSVSTPSKTEHGSVTVSPKSASKGDTVTVTVKPDSGYVLETLTVTDKNGNELTLKDKGNGKYTFTMPAGKVEVKATFMEDNSMLNFFYDVPNNAYFYEAVKWAVKNGITDGVGNNLFAPERPCTRAQIVTFLWRAAGSPEPKGAASGMTDVVSGSYYEKAVAWAIENGITTGTTTSTFSPDATCTRAQAVTFLARALKAKAASAAEFSDVPTDSYFADAVAWAAANGVTEGIGGGLFGSDNDCTRGQIVTFLYRAYNK